MRSPVDPGATAPNRLAAEKSPYLRQHQFNPVDWRPWGEAAFAQARAEQKPVFLSVGYSTCHWCHVMAHESFESPEIAALLNAHFIAVKVDREERPDVDRLYMGYVQATTGRGGWPMSVWLTPELKPFFGGTYYPPEERWGQPGFGTLLLRIAEAWRSQRAEIERHAGTVVESLREAAAVAPAPAAGALDPAAIAAAAATLRGNFDPEWGGFGHAPKFPRPVLLNLLFRVATRGETDSAEARRMADLTLQRMAEGGMRDHLGGGFHRYSVDAHWHVPHFEKMLYDQAQLAAAYLEGSQATGRGIYAWIAREIFEYVRRDLGAPGGAFFSAEDADSARADAPAEQGEGAFYVWTKWEMERAAGPDAALAVRHFGVREEGNAPPGADPHGELAGFNTLHQAQPLAKTAAECGLPVAEAEQRLLALQERLLAARARRPRPHRDEKILTGWNGLMIGAFARGAQVLGEPGWRGVAEGAAEWLAREMYEPGPRRLYRNWCEGRGDIPAFADDHAFLIAGLLDLYEAGGAIRWLQWAVALQEVMIERFWDEEGGGFFGSVAGDPSILFRQKEDYDGAEPAANSVAALNLLRLATMLGRDDWRRRAEATIAAFRPQWERAPTALPQMLVAMDFALGPVRQVVLAGPPDSPGLRALQAELHRGLEAPRVVLWADGGSGQEWLAGQVAFFRHVAPIDGRPAAYVCRNFTCRLPVTDARDLAAELR